jgi:hypothetical protein
VPEEEAPVDEQTRTPPAQQPRDAEPGRDGAPGDADSSEPVGLEDRTAPGRSGAGYTGSPVGNQGKSEPMPATTGHPDPNAPLEPPLLAQMNVGADDPQTPRHPAAAGSALTPSAPAPGPGALGGAGTAPGEQRPGPSLGVSTGRATGPQNPDSVRPGTSHKAPGVMGVTGPDEALETDVESGAGRMSPSGAPSLPSTDDPGDAQDVPVPSHDAAIGTSEEHAAVRGARTATRGS